MDPDTTLEELRELAARIKAIQEADPPLGEYDVAELAGEMVETFHGLDDWMSTGGFAPAAWNQPAGPSTLADYPSDSGKQIALNTLSDREVAPREEIIERIAEYERGGGDLWLDFFGPLFDRIEEAIFDRGQPS